MNKHKSLKECIKIYENLGFNPDSYETSINAIITFARQDDVLLSEIIELNNKLIKDRADKQDKIIRRFRAEGIYPYDYYRMNYPKDVAGTLEYYTRKIIASMELSEVNLDNLREIASKYELKSPFYVELLEVMHEHGIFFINEEKERQEYTEAVKEMEDEL